MPHAMHAAAESWSVPVPLTLLLVSTAAVYVNGWRRLRAASRDISVWHAAGFVGGLVSIWIAVASPLASWDRGSLTAHMIQHLLLMTCAPPLILLSDPARCLLYGLPLGVVAGRDHRDHSTRGRCVRGRGVRTSAVVLARRHRGAGGLAYSAHLRARASIECVARHSSRRHSCSSGLLFWWPVIEPWPSAPNPRWSIVLYLFLATLPCDILSGFLMFSDRVAYSVFRSMPGRDEVAILSDQQSAAALMWTVVTVIYLVAGTLVATRLLARPSASPTVRDPPRNTGVEVH